MLIYLSSILHLWFPLCLWLIISSFLFPESLFAWKSTYTSWLAIESSAFYYTNHNDAPLHNVEIFHNSFLK